MTVAVVVVSSADLREDALAWGKAGLIADSFWVSSDDAGRIDPDRPNSVSARRVLPREVQDPAPLALSLAQLGSLDEIRVAWIRPPDAEFSEAMKGLQQLLREMLPFDVTRWLDIVVPSARTDATVAPLPGQWLQLRIVAEDRSAPDVTDAGWDLDLDVPLHSALVAAGVLTGTFRRLPWGAQSAAEHFEFRTFSRLVLGALEANVESDRFIAQVIPRSSAGSFYPTRYIELAGDSAERLVSEALTYVLELDSATLSYNDPAPSRLQSPPRLTVLRHVVAFTRFLGFGLLSLFGRRTRPEPGTHSSFDVDDLGYNVADTAPSAPARIRIPDFDALDAEAAEAASRELTALDRQLRRDPPLPPSRVWRSLVRLATSLTDGGSHPDGWDPPEHHGRKPVLAPDRVQPGPHIDVRSETPELAEARNTAIAHVAIREARRPRHIPLVAPADATGVVATAQRLVAEGNSRDAERLAEQTSDISVSGGAAPGRLLDEVAGHVIGAALRARLDSERWTEWATGPSERDPLGWSRVESRARRRTRIGLGVCAAMAVLWAIVSDVASDALPSWLNRPTGFIAVGALAAATLLWNLYVFFKEYSAFLERGRRRLEIRRRWLERAQVAMREHARLGAARALMGKWLDILAEVYPPGEVTVSAIDRTMPSSAPKGMAVGVPVYDEREITKWLIDDAAKVGWRMRALERIASVGLGAPAADAIKRLVEDDGLKGGPLTDLWERRTGLWEDLAQELRDEASRDVAAHFLDGEHREVRILTPRSRESSPLPFRSFEAEPWPDADADDVAIWDEHRDFTMRDGLAHGGGGTISLNDDTCAVAIRAQLRRLDQPHRPGAPQGPTPAAPHQEGTF